MHRLFFMYNWDKLSKEEKKIECSICGQLVNSKIRTKRTPCHHLFHTKCIKKFASKNRKCPTCGVNLSKTKYISLIKI